MTTITEEMVNGALAAQIDLPGGPYSFPLEDRAGMRRALTAALSKLPPAPDWQGRCDVTLTERFEYRDCRCGTYEGNLGPCKSFLLGAAPDRCVYCDHKIECHHAAASPPDRNAVIEECAKIEHRGIFIERQSQGGSKYLFICHTGISKFLPDLYETQAQAINAVDAKLDRGLSILLRRAKHHIEAALDLTEENRLALAVQGRALIREIEAALPAIRALKTNPGNAALNQGKRL